jgi:hypothetical protein
MENLLIRETASCPAVGHVRGERAGTGTTEMVARVRYHIASRPLLALS